MQTIKIKTKEKQELIDLTKEIENKVKRKTGICCLFLKHTTSAILINENETGLKKDFFTFLNSLIPKIKWQHNKIDNNAASHLMAGLIGPCKFVPVKDGKLILGKWQSIFLIEFDGPRERELVIDVR